MIPLLIVINKVDLITKENLDMVNEVIALYSSIGYDLLMVLVQPAQSDEFFIFCHKLAYYSEAVVRNNHIFFVSIILHSAVLSRHT